MKPNDNNSLAHTTWNCKYHIVLPIVISITHVFVNKKVLQKGSKKVSTFNTQ